MLLSSLEDHNGVVDVEEIEGQVHNSPGGVGQLPERLTILKS
jgi:hypothetical protein